MAVVNAGVSGTPEQQATEIKKESMATAVNLSDMFAKCSSQGGWTGTSLEYLSAIRKIIEDPSRPGRATMQYISDDAVAFSTPDKLSVVLVKDSDLPNVQAILADAMYYNAKTSFYNAFPNHTLLNIVGCNRFMYNRPSQMAAYISQIFMAQQNEQIRSFTIDSFNDQYRINIDTDLGNVRQFFENNSPSPVVCGDFGFIASLVDKNEPRYNMYHDAKKMFGVTGYVEFVRNDGAGLFFTPIVHVTDIHSVMASTKILALAIPLIGEVFMNRNLWRSPFTAIGKSMYNIGNLVIDPTTSKPAEVKNDLDFRKMFHEYIRNPILSIDVRVGHPCIPGLNNITRPSDHNLLANEIFSFMNVNPGIIEGIGENIFKEIVGIFETSKTDRYSNLMDTRDLNYLYVVSKTKWSPALDFLLTRNDTDPIRRFENLKTIFDGIITPVSSSITTMFYDKFIKQVASAMASKVIVDIPIAADLPNIDLTSFAAKAYQPGISMFQSGPSRYVGSGILRW